MVKPYVGTAATSIWESRADTRLAVSSAQASTNQGTAFLPKNAIDDGVASRWRSAVSAHATQTEWLSIDLGMPQTVREVYIDWSDAYARDYRIQVAHEREDCRANGDSCPDGWTTVSTTTGKADSYPTSNLIDDTDHDLQGVRYVRILMDVRSGTNSEYSVNYVQVFRKKMIVGEDPNGVSCGGTIAAVAGSLLSSHGGALIQTYENAEYFAASMTDAQKDSMMGDACVFAVEPNYVVRARGRTTKRRTQDLKGKTEEEEHRKLAIPEFNLMDENPANWGLERISSHGAKNGRYKWVHEGRDTHVFLFDTGLYPDSADWNFRNGTSRLSDGVVCAGTSTDHVNADHGTHMASIAAGWTHGTAKSAFIHPVQVLDSNDEGSTASLLCGLEWLLQYGIDYYATNAPKAIRGVVNLSLGVDGRSDVIDKVVHDMIEVGYTVVIAAGDHDDNACFYSPYDHDAITVGALSDDEDGYNDKTLTSNYGECIDVWAPGEDIVAAANDGEYESVSKSGTSVAAAFVTGVASLFFEAVNSKDQAAGDMPALVKERMMDKAELDILGDVGYGSVNRIVQTTASRCLSDGHCSAGLTCMPDGVCVDWAKVKQNGKGKRAGSTLFLQ